jgi:hypothetical protein
LHYSCLAKVAFVLVLGFAGTRHISEGSDNPESVAIFRSREVTTLQEVA